MTRNYSVTQYNVHIPDSFEVSKWCFGDVLLRIRRHYPDSEVWMRSLRSLCAEWACHNFAYKIGLWRSRTRDVDLNYPLPWYASIGYFLGGSIVWPFIK